MRHLQYTLLAASIAGACVSKQAPKEVSKTLADVGLDTAALNRKADPCTDFYEFACGGWLQATPIPPDKSRWSRSFSEIDKRNEETLRDILEAARTAPGDDPVLQKLGAFYGACMDEAAIEKAGITPLKPLFAQADAVTDASTLADAVIALHKTRSWALFDIAAEQDFKDATKVVAFLDQNGLGMPDRDYYLKDDAKSQEIRTAYLGHVERMLAIAGASPEAAKASAQQIMDLETAIAKVSKTRVERRDPAGLYNPIGRAGLEKKAPHFPWDRYFAALGRPDLQDVIVTSVPFFEGIDALIASTKPEAWRPYLRWTALRSTAGSLPKAFVDESFAFSKVLTGQQQLEDRWKRCIDATDGALGELLAQPYLARRFAGDSKRATEEMIQGITRAFAANLKQLDWMDEPTRARAKEKLDAMVWHIGYPVKWKEYTWSVDPASHATNVLTSRGYELQRDLAKIGKPVDRQEWLMSPPTVNAYYNPLKNEMVFPAGILQPPFFDVNASIAVNLGGMGMVVGHELTHGFDDQGAQFAADGNLKNWWEPAVGEKFKAKTKCVSDQYGKYEAIPGVSLNGDLTLGENIADIGGVKMAFRAYREMTAKNPERVVAEGFTEDQQFFLAVGQAWCMNAREEVARMLAQVDPHSPPRWRVNGALSDIPEFKAAFQCAPGKTMAPTNACEVW